MSTSGLLSLALLLISTEYSAFGAPPETCTTSARALYPCELSFSIGQSKVSPYEDETMTVEFRSPGATTYLLRGFWSAPNTLRVRFTPTEPGTWTYRTSGSLHGLQSEEKTFSVAETNLPGMISVANLRHWRTASKQPHLWLSSEVPLASLGSADLNSWLDARKHDGFTHIRGALLTSNSSQKPLTPDGQPNFAYFDALDESVLAAANKGFVLDLLFAESGFLKSGVLDQPQTRDPLVRYLIARYGGLNVTWQGVERFEDRVGSRELLKELGSALERYDAYRHPRSTDARASSSPLLPDNWMNYLMESSPHPELGAVEHQFTQMPEIHFVTATEPSAFRHEVWSATTNGEYLSISYGSLRNEANVRAIQAWSKIISDTRHWELEPYFDISGARAVGLEEVEYLAYAQTGGIIEITLAKHKYNPLWINPITGEEILLKDYKGEIYSLHTPSDDHDWLLHVPREGHKESMLRSYRFESVDPPVQEIESDTSRMPFQVIDPTGDEFNSTIPVPYKAKVVRANRASRTIQYLWWGDVIAGGEGARLLGVGSSGNLSVPKELVKQPGSTLNLRVQAINANGKAYEVDKVFRLTP